METHLVDFCYYIIADIIPLSKKNIFRDMLINLNRVSLGKTYNIMHLNGTAIRVFPDLLGNKN